MVVAGAKTGSGLPRLLLVAAAGVCAFPWPLIDKRLAQYQIEFGLGLGIVLALMGLVHAGPMAKKVSKYAIQVCVVLLGLRMDLHKVLQAGSSGLLFAVGTIAGTFLLGWLLGRMLKTDGKISTLLSSGTAICGGSAIAAVSSVIGATSTQISIATATIFILNGLALYLFPFLGGQLHLTPTQFGTWAGVAIHDVSSVVGAAQSFDGGHGAAATDTATVVKLSRVLWIIPICIAAAWWMAKGAASATGRAEAGNPTLRSADPPKKAKLPIPWFIGLFILAAGLRTLWQQRGAAEAIASADRWISLVARCGMALALFLIGAGLSRKALASVGWRPLAQGVVMWVFISVVALMVVRATVA